MNGRIPIEDDSEMFRTFKLLDTLRKHSNQLTEKEKGEFKKLGITIDIYP